MRGSFWQDQAWRVLISPAWPWLDVDAQGRFAARVRGILDPYWGKRLQGVPEHFLSAGAVRALLEGRMQLGAEHPVAAGMEKVAQAAAGEADAFWFFDLGCTAWMLRLAEMRREGLVPEPEQDGLYREIEQVWAAQGPAAALAHVEARMAGDRMRSLGLCLYHVPLALWQKRSAPEAMASLDAAMGGLTRLSQAALGITLPLTYGHLLALTGDLAGAEAILNEHEIPVSNGGWIGFASPAVRYQRARILWAQGEMEAARHLLARIAESDASYLLRMVTDPALMGPDGQRDGSLMATLGDQIDRARSQVMRWQHSRPDRERNTLAQTRADATLGALRAMGGEAYVVLAAAAAARSLEDRSGSFSHSFRADYKQVADFVAGLPPTFPLTLGEGYARVFSGSDDSDMARLERLVREENAPEATRMLLRIMALLPSAIRVGVAHYAARLCDALATAAETLHKSEAPEDRRRLQLLSRLWDRCISLADLIRNLPDDVGPALLSDFASLWSKIAQVEEAWVASEGRAYGQLRLIPPTEVLPIRAGTFRAYHFQVQDASGRPVAGAPVLWRVRSGPAQPKEPSRNLALEWTSSLETGRVLVAVAAGRESGAGEIEARVLGGREPVRIVYRVEDGPRGA
jgi:hypothetical protein